MKYIFRFFGLFLLTFVLFLEFIWELSVTSFRYLKTGKTFNIYQYNVGLHKYELIKDALTKNGLHTSPRLICNILDYIEKKSNKWE